MNYDQAINIVLVIDVILLILGLVTKRLKIGKALLSIGLAFVGPIIGIIFILAGGNTGEKITGVFLTIFLWFWGLVIVGLFILINILMPVKKSNPKNESEDIY